MLKKIALGIAVVFVATPAHAAPVYLECRLTGGGDSEELLWNVTLNEETSMVSWTIPSVDVADSARAVFTPDEVHWSGGIASFTISRTSLTFTRTLDMGGGTPHVTQGRCQIAARRDRAF